MHVLIADDDPVYRSFLDDLLEQWKFDVTVAYDGQEAWEAIQGNEDIRLGRAVYTILVTGSRLKEDVIRVLVSGADDYIAKPFDAIDLKIHVRTAMRVINLETEVSELRRSLEGQGRSARTVPSVSAVQPVEQSR